MTLELKMLVYTAALVSVMWLPYILARIAQYGVVEALTYRADGKPVAAWAERAKKAHYNAVENLLPFAVLVLAAHVLGIHNGATTLAAMTFFWARVAHFVAYTAGIPLARTLTFAVGWAAMICLLVQILVGKG